MSTSTSLLPAVPRVLFGGDYNPEQWPEDVWVEDVRLMREAGVNLATVGVFSWALLEPQPGVYDFGWLDRVLDLLAENEIFASLATATASPPPWLARHHPESLPVTADGTTLWPGSRQHYCPSSTAYRNASRELVERLAERYARHPALALWHVNNEYACHVPACFCDRSAAHFREWLEQRYETVDRLNSAWGTAFWSQRYGDWEEVNPPRTAPAFANPSQQLDWHRFCSDAILELYLGERAILERHTPDVPITTNFMGFFKHMNYWTWAEHVDLVADDIYPDPADPDGAQWRSRVADLMRSLGGGKPWLLMEQAPNHVNWRQRNAPKAPGEMRLGSYQSLARGADGIQFFQWRASFAGAEKFHSAMVPHAGTATRTWEEIVDLGGELAKLTDVCGTRVAAEVAIAIDWESWWALETAGMPSHDLQLSDLVGRWYRPFWERNLTTDFAHPEADLSGYKLVVVPNLYLLRDAGAENLTRFVADGGTLVVSFFSGIVDENDHVRLGGYPAALRALLGLVVPEFCPHGEGESGSVILDGQAYSCELWSDSVELEGAEPVATFDGGWLAGRPAVTRRSTAWYVGTQLDREGMDALVALLATETGLKPELDAPEGVEVVRRSAEDRSFLFLLNHTQETAEVTVGAETQSVLDGDEHLGTVVLPPFGVAVLRDP